MKSSFITLLLMLAGLLLGAEVRAEAFIDIYGGGAFTSDRRSDVIVPPQEFNPYGRLPPNEPPLGLPDLVIRRTSVDTNFEDSITYGMRGGYWFGKWFGLALDVFTFEPNLDAESFTQDADVRVIPISALMMLRWPLLASEEFPLGRLHPYIGGGPGLFLTKFEGNVDLAVFDFPDTGRPGSILPPWNPPIPNIEPAGEFSSKNVDPGMELLVGLDFQILPFVGVFAEYRYTLAEPVWSSTIPAGGTDPSIWYEALPTDFQVNLRTHHIVGGITFRF
jgi:opacity protein-like surface antigen